MVLTGGTTAEKIYPHLARTGIDLGQVTVIFSDERCVPPDDPASNYGMAKRLLLDAVPTGRVERMRGEDDPVEAARAYDERIRTDVALGLGVVLLGMGADCHICALFPGSPVIDEDRALCAPVDRPDGMRGLSLTPMALLGARQILLLVTGAAKATAVARAFGEESPKDCPVRLLADHPDVTFLLDGPAASALDG